MYSFAKIAARLGLLLTLTPCLLYLFDLIDLGTVKLLMIVGMVLWFACSPVVQHINEKRSGGDGL
ncbi:hypothetical protein H5P28_07905 [Ruficoccus amylovorans]|uniref:Uncharacterized protein n=1 Tax=Ruficoccus amylovorans TaxID=1804625 RepID=A0A842HF83_9BACT|nr:hypothetical protein [Ruficoccus amylovorans]MBC2594184.1 hypothetical protein [Ruficoccus amylovorans]